jgi:hypothetical protein
MNVDIGTEAEQFLFWAHINRTFVAVRALVISSSYFLLSFRLVLPIVLSTRASYCPFILSFLLLFRHLFPLVLSSSASSCFFIVSFFMSNSNHPLFLHVLYPPLSRPCPLIIWFILKFHFLLLLVLSSSGFSCPFILCFILPFHLCFFCPFFLCFSSSFHPRLLLILFL